MHYFVIHYLEAASAWLICRLLLPFFCLISLWALGHNITSHLLFPVAAFTLGSISTHTWEYCMSLESNSPSWLQGRSGATRWNRHHPSYWFMIWRATIKQGGGPIILQRETGESVLALTRGEVGVGEREMRPALRSRLILTQNPAISN